MFYSKSLIISGLILRSLIHFEFIFVYDVRKCSNFILLNVAVQFSQHHLLKRLSLPHYIFLHSLSKIRQFLEKKKQNIILVNKLKGKIFANFDKSFCVTNFL